MPRANPDALHTVKVIYHTYCVVTRLPFRQRPRNPNITFQLNSFFCTSNREVAIANTVYVRVVTPYHN